MVKYPGRLTKTFLKQTSVGAKVVNALIRKVTVYISKSIQSMGVEKVHLFLGMHCWC